MSTEFIKVSSPQINENDVEAAVAALTSGILTSGPKVAEFESAFAEYCGSDYAISTNNGTVAIQAALAASGVGIGDEVIVPALTFFSTATAAILQGAVPVFCDISGDNYCMDPQDLESKITSRTKAIIPVHYFGHAAEMDKIMNIAAKHNLIVIEDCAQAHGTLYKGKRVGSIGHFGAFSMFATKHMTTAGEGGIVTTNNEEAASFIKKFRSHGMEGRHDHVLLGSNYRLPEIGGAVGLSQLSRLEQMNDDRIRACEKLIAKLKGISWLKLPVVPEYVKHTYFWCHVEIDEKQLNMDTESLISKLREQGIEVRYRYVEPLYKQPLLNEFLPEILKLSAGNNLPNYGEMFLPNVERIAGKLIGLPNRPDLTDKEIERIAEVLLSFGK